jgi:hypothetical protein
MLQDNDKTIVTVTYDKERYFLELHIRSINKYLEPCEIILIYCDKHNKYDDWLFWVNNNISPLAPKHKIVTYNAEFFYDISKVISWQSFAYSLRIFCSTVVNTENYWIFDTKVFFFKPTTFDQLLEQYPRNLLDTDFEEVLREIQSYYSIINTYFKTNTTPFKFNTAITKLMVEKGINFNNTNVGYAEIYYYQAFCFKNGIQLTSGSCDVNNSIAYSGYNYSSKQLIAYMKSKDPAVRCTGLHRAVAEKLDKNTFDVIIAYVGGKDLKPITTPWIFN